MPGQELQKARTAGGAGGDPALPPFPRPVQVDAAHATFESAAGAWTWDHAVRDGTLHVHGVHGDGLTFRGLHQMLDVLWHRLGVRAVHVPHHVADRLPLNPVHWTHGDGLTISRAAFYQVREAWLAPALHPVMPEVHVEADCPGGRHPLRPRVPDGVLYQKHLAATGELFELRRAEVGRDGERFHRWQNDPRVARFWEEARSREELDAYLQKRRDDPHCEPLVGCIDGEPFAYLEAYWAREDRIAPYYVAQDHDLGVHLLVGESRFLGAARTQAWLRALNHYMFLLDPRTRRLVGEPRADNEAVIWLAQTVGYRKLKEFDFPHKRAALLMCTRESFFGGQHP